MPTPAEPPSPSPSLLRRPMSFWRAAAAAGLAAAGFALLDAPQLRIDAPGGMPLFLLAAAIALAGPPRLFEKHGLRELSVIALAGMGFAWPLVQALGFTYEKNAALLSVPYWAFAIGALGLGWRLRQQDMDLPLLCFGAAALTRCGYLIAKEGFVRGELLWWGVSLVWIVGVLTLRPLLQRSVPDSVPLVAVVAWFVLMTGTLTLQEYRNPALEFAPRDDAAAIDAARERPLRGWGIGGFENVMQQHAHRPPDAAPMVARGALRLFVETGLFVPLCLGFAAILSVAYTVGERPWDRGRTAAIGVAGLWCIAALALREPVLTALVPVCLLWPAALGRIPLPEKVVSEDFIPPRAWISFATLLVVVLVPAITLPLAKWHYQRQGPLQNIGVRSFLPHWGEPYREQAWLVRDRSEEIARGADPRHFLRPLAEAWVDAEPHNTFAQFEKVRWADRALSREEAERVALRAHRQLPWSQELAAFVVRLKIEQGKREEALRFLQQYGAQYGPLGPQLVARLVALREELEPAPR